MRNTPLLPGPTPSPGALSRTLKARQVPSAFRTQVALPPLPHESQRDRNTRRAGATADTQEAGEATAGTPAPRPHAPAAPAQRPPTGPRPRDLASPAPPPPRVLLTAAALHGRRSGVRGDLAQPGAGLRGGRARAPRHRRLRLRAAFRAASSGDDSAARTCSGAAAALPASQAPDPGTHRRSRPPPRPPATTLTTAAARRRPPEVSERALPLPVTRRRGGA